MDKALDRETLEINGKKLDAKKVAETREIFERNHAGSKKGRLSFDELLDRISIDCNSLSSIAIEHGVSRWMLCLLYEKYFRDLFPGGKKPKRRKEVCTLKRIVVATREIPDGTLLGFVMEAAKRAGLDVKRLRYEGSNKVASSFFRKRFVAQGKTCFVSHLTSARKTSRRCDRRYGLLVLVPSHECDFRIVIADFLDHPRKVFVIPAKDLPDQALNVPCEKLSVYNNHRPTIDWWQYENAWHLIKA